MIDPNDEILDEPTPASLPWVRKRDGSVVAFDTGKLASSLYAACEQLGADDAAFRAQEFSQIVLHFLGEEFERTVPSTDDVSEMTIRALREIGQAPIAAAYHDFRNRRRSLRDDVTILQARGSHPEATSLPFQTADDLERLGAWDKSKVAAALQDELDLDAGVSRDIASAVEKSLLSLRLDRISAGLIRELVDCELAGRGLRRLLDRRRLLSVSCARVNELLDDASDEAIHHRLGGEILEQFALQEVFSRDVAALHWDGLLHLFDLESPGHWPALSADVPRLAMRSADDASILESLEESLTASARRVGGVLAIEAPDAVAALTAQSDADPFEQAKKTCGVLRRTLAASHVRLAINLFGRVPDFVSDWLSEGPLFRVRPTPAQHRFALAFCDELSRRILDDDYMSVRCRIDFHPLAETGDEELRSALAPWARRIAAGGDVTLCFDRNETELAEGLLWSNHGRSAVYQYVGVNLPAAHERIGATLDDDNLTQRLALLCESAVRAGVQRREFLRRRQPELFGGRDHRHAVVVIVPIGLDRLVSTMLGASLGESEAADAFAAQLLTRLQKRLDRESKHYQLRCRIDGAPRAETDPAMQLMDAPGPTPASGNVSAEDQLAAAGALRQALGSGGALCRLESDPDADRVLDLMLQARSAHIGRLRFQHPLGARQRELFDAI